MFSAVPVPPPPGVNIEEHIQIRQEEKRQRINRRHRLEEGRGMDQIGFREGLEVFLLKNSTWWEKVGLEAYEYVEVTNKFIPFSFF